MIGGAMLTCAVGAMILIAYWSIYRDDVPDVQDRNGILAVGKAPAIQKKVKGPRKRRSGLPETAVTLGMDDFDMAKIAKEAEETLPEFVRTAREDY
jgi:hypothetical protein